MRLTKEQLAEELASVRRRDAMPRAALSFAEVALLDLADRVEAGVTACDEVERAAPDVVRHIRAKLEPQS